MAKEDIKIRLKSIEKVEQVLQESYDLTCKEINEIQNEMNKLMNSTTLSNLIMEDKARYAKAMHDFIGDKTKAIALKFEIAKFMGEIIKHNGDVGKTISDMNNVKATKMDLRSLRNEITKAAQEGNDGEVTYNTKDKD